MITDGTSERRRQRAAEAARWLVTLRSGHVSADERAAFVDWLRESPTHIAEMLRVAQLHGALEDFGNWSEVGHQAAPAPDTVIAFSEHAGTLAAPMPAPAAKKQWAFAAAAAALACVAIAIVLLASRPEGQAIHTSSGERSEVVLADGSIVDVAPETQLRVKLAKLERHVLIEHGQAYFHVQKDSARPFVVEAAGTHIRAVGTAFNVDRRDTGVIVTVTEGKVSVSSTPARGTAQKVPVMLAANQQLIISPQGVIGPVQETDSASAVTWLVGQLDFDNQTIAEVAQRFNSYNKVQIVIQDAALAGSRITGTFRMVDPESFINFIQATYPGVVIHREDDRIIVTVNQRTRTSSHVP